MRSRRDIAKQFGRNRLLAAVAGRPGREFSLVLLDLNLGREPRAVLSFGTAAVDTVTPHRGSRRWETRRSCMTSSWRGVCLLPKSGSGQLLITAAAVHLAGIGTYMPTGIVALAARAATARRAQRTDPASRRVLELLSTGIVEQAHRPRLGHHEITVRRLSHGRSYLSQTLCYQSLQAGLEATGARDPYLTVSSNGRSRAYFLG